ncbi:hypothetical protein SNOG_07332 [Parastagonospora nodorum SN15]|uniref:Bromo domain-containing protein n=1 Tax=Phaeosphaeria nodorum (strain SN15 / ATCC MYA-4574 / FGSC 10173) TaxID=321614 RepID=Q0ULN2_PHANO|nr:hypothetical protein SNOG_07332 [Parastagonospora nodorum SN15]EAT84798.2 hypothetical protein SNOG_07332 [Parastagonospora nodorum SN15]
MNTSGSAYTNLESLLLFQCLRAYGVGNNVFGRISDLLKKNPDVTGNKYFQSGRLSPDALRNFYLERLRRELEHEQGDSSDDANADGANPRKRKKASPALPTVQESLQHQHLIPKLVNKLYASYRHEVVEQIRAEEDRYEKLQRELKSIERGEWDDQLRERANGRTPAPRSPTLPRKSPHLAQKPLQPASPQAAPNGAPTPDAQPAVDPARAAQNSTSPRRKQAALEQRPTTTTPQPAASASPQPNLAQPLAPPPPRFQPSPHPPYNGPAYQNQPYPPGQQPQAPPNVPLQPGQHPSSPAVGLQPHPYGTNGPPHLRALKARTSSNDYSTHPHNPTTLSMRHSMPSRLRKLASCYRRSKCPRKTRRVCILSRPQRQTTLKCPRLLAIDNSRRLEGAGVQTPGNGRQGIPPMHPLVTQARHSLSTPINSRSPISAMGTPVSAKSVWKRSMSFAGTPAASPRPVPEPIDDFVPLETPRQSPAKPKSQRKPRAKGKGKEKDSEQAPADDAAPETESQPDDTVVEVETRSGRSRRKAPPKRARPGSLASSRAGGSVRDRSRSQSILSHTETVAADNESQAGNRIKSERATSIDAIDEESVDTPSQMTTRRRGAATRRKRNAREASLEEPEDHFSTPGPPRTIIAPRYFARTCAPIMNDIQSHKHASTFSAAVRAKDAEGYYDIIKRPTDLKTIQKAIASGAKQVASAASDTPAGSPGGGGGVVELPVIPDNIPPKSIVNAAQLEKELMRMFVNAVMFNPGEDGVVEDAREMFETVQRSVSTWRNVERSSGRTEVEDTPTVEEDEAPSGKRRKV